jgi:hypothetical protein
MLYFYQLDRVITLKTLCLANFIGKLVLKPSKHKVRDLSEITSKGID